MILNDKELINYSIKYKLVSPFNEKNVQPASIDLTLGQDFLFPSNENSAVIDIDKDKIKYIKWNDVNSLIIMPGQFLLATTVEKVTIPDNCAAFVQGRSSIGRLGLFIENAGFIDPGFSGQITLEIYNASRMSYILHPGRRICQLIVHRLTSPAVRPYEGKYQNQVGTTGSKLYKDLEVNWSKKEFRKEDKNASI